MIFYFGLIAISNMFSVLTHTRHTILAYYVFLPQINRIHFVMCFMRFQQESENKYKERRRERKREKEKRNTKIKWTGKEKWVLNLNWNSFHQLIFWEKENGLYESSFFFSINFLDHFLLFSSIVRYCVYYTMCKSLDPILFNTKMRIEILEDQNTDHAQYFK